MKILMNVLTVLSIALFIFGAMSLDSNGTVIPYILAIAGLAGVAGCYAGYWKNLI